MSEINVEIPDRFTPADQADRKVFEVAPQQVYRHEKTGDTFCVGGVLLEDGQNTRWVAWPEGARFAAIRPENDWALEEHFEGEPPEHLRIGVDWAWRVIVNAMIEANRVCREAEQKASRG